MASSLLSDVYQIVLLDQVTVSLSFENSLLVVSTLSGFPFYSCMVYTRLSLLNKLLDVL